MPGRLVLLAALLLVPLARAAEPAKGSSDARGDGVAGDGAPRTASDPLTEPSSDDPAQLEALADLAVGPDDAQAAAALRRLSPPRGEAARRLAAAYVRRLALGQPAPRLPRVLSWNLGDAELAAAFRAGLAVSVDDGQRVRLLAALSKTRVVDRLPDDHWLRLEVGRLAGSLNPELASLAEAVVAGRAAPDAMAVYRITTAADAVVRAVGGGQLPEAEALRPFLKDAGKLAGKLAPSLASTNPGVRRAAAQTLVALRVDGGASLRRLLVPLLKDADAATRRAAAELLHDERALAVARVLDLIADCRAEAPSLRENAARQLHELNVFPRPLTAALVRAVGARDMAGREGLLRAFERAHAGDGDPLASLRAAAGDADAATRAYARAALRAIGPTAERGNKP